MRQAAETAQEPDSFPEILLRPVGVIKSQIKEPVWTAGPEQLDWRAKVQRAKANQRLVSEVIINRELESLLDGIEEFSHLLVLYWPHLIPPERRSVTRVHPTGREDFPLVGVFATRSPARPNMILATVVELLEREGNVLRVTGLDAIDGSPVLDIKPHSRDHHDIGKVRIPPWMVEIQKALAEG